MYVGVGCRTTDHQRIFKQERLKKKKEEILGDNAGTKQCKQPKS